MGEIKLNFFKNKKLLFKWSVSYLILLFVTITVNICAYIVIEKRIVDINNQNAIETLKYKKQSIDELRSSLLNISYGISQNADIRKLAINTKVLDASNRIDFFNLMGKTRSYFGIDSHFNNVFIYFNNIDYITGDNITATSGQYYDFYYSDKNISKNDWHSLLASNHFGDFVNFSSKGEDKGKGNMLFLYSLYGNERFKPYATIVIEVEYSDFFPETIDDYDDRMFLVLDEDQNILVSDRSTDIDYAQNFLSNNEITEGITDHGDVVTVSVLSEAGDWSYVNIITKKAFKKSVNESRMIIIICNIICIGFLSWLSFALSNSNYRPLKKIINTLDGGDDDIKGGEFQYINSKINQILLENRNISKKSRKQDEMLKELFLLKILSNSALPKNKDEILEELDISFPYENFMCVLIRFEINDDMFFDDKNDDPDTAYNMAKLVVTNILNEKLDRDCLKYYCDMENTLCILINTSEENYNDVLYNTVTKLHEFATDNFNIKFVAGISKVYKSSNNIPRCYSEAKKCFDYRFMEQRHIVKYEDIAQDDAEGYYYPHAQEERLIRMIRVRDIEGCKNVLDEIFEKNFSERKISDEQAKHLLLIMVSTIEERAGLNKQVIADVQKISDAIKSGTMTTPVIKQKIYNMVIGICNNHDNEQSSHIRDTVGRLKDYISDNYSTPDLNVNTVAQKFNITSSYLSTIFKKNTGVGLQEYILSVRMEHAKMILSITNYTIEEVAVMVGYVNARSFSRAFSKYVGISPGKYKEINQNTENI